MPEPPDRQGLHGHDHGVRSFGRSHQPTPGTINIKVTNQNDAPLTPTVGLGTPDTRTPQISETDNAPSYMVDENHAVKDVDDDPDG